VRRAFLRAMLRSVLVPLGVVLLCAAVRAQPLERVGEPQQSTLHDEQQQQRRQNTFTAGVLLLFGVTTIGLLLITAAVIWGAKVRRLARRAEPATERPDDLWYLRKTLPPDKSSDEPSSPGE
jgi:hypothetical protein